jgi:hypothetical protein
MQTIRSSLKLTGRIFATTALFGFSILVGSSIMGLVFVPSIMINGLTIIWTEA